jgi:uncharacterized protein YhbP (UPF0306 family)
MLHLVYRFRLKQKATSNTAGFWQWVRERQPWFYGGLDMVIGTKWYVVTIGPDVHAVEHHVTFADEAAWGAYRKELSRRSHNPEWEKRRIDQDEWWDMLDARLLTDAPVENAGAGDMANLEPYLKRSHFLLENARYITLATNDQAGNPWASTVNYVVLYQPLRLLWYSLRAAKHSRNIEVKPEIAATLFSTDPRLAEDETHVGVDGAQLFGTAREVDPEELNKYHQIYYTKNFPDPEIRNEWMLPLEDFHSEGPRRFYLLEPQQWWLFDKERWVRDKSDTRLEVPLTYLNFFSPGRNED